MCHCVLALPGSVAAGDEGVASACPERGPLDWSVGTPGIRTSPSQPRGRGQGGRRTGAGLPASLCPARLPSLSPPFQQHTTSCRKWNGNLAHRMTVLRAGTQSPSRGSGPHPCSPRCFPALRACSASALLALGAGVPCCGGLLCFAGCLASVCQVPIASSAWL